ncbi:MAG TPA: ADOP family duplicated permease [Bryobacteraceae bacterium]|nr:ADOP family duplicated permease [Bryobacteraceae bacterium]HZW91919.1 ADOP family duplicated permease [Candidatus Eremiobacteraceae bacterium]
MIAPATGMSLEPLWQDLRIALRVLRKNRGTTLLCIVSIALGIGLTTGIFGLTDAIFLRPFAFDRPGEVYWISSRGDDGNQIAFCWPDYQDMLRASSNVADLVTYERVGGTLGTGDDRQSVLVYPSTPNYFQFLGVKALVGRASLEPIGAEPAVVIGYRLWQQKFGGDPQIAGKKIILSGHGFVVAGVMPAEFTGLLRGVPNDIWISMEDWFNLPGRAAERYERDAGNFEIIARLKPGVSPQRAAAQFDAAIRGPEKRKPAPAGQTGTVLEVKFATGWEDTLIYGGGLLLVLGLVLFVACANVAQLRLALSETRKKELGIRLALGAGSWRVARQLLVETALVSFAGAGAGLWLAGFLMQQVSAFITAASPYLDYGLRLDYRVLTFAMASAVCAVLFSALAPTRHAVKMNVSEVLKSEQGTTGAGRTWQKQALVVGQIAVSVMLFGMAVLFFESFRNTAALRPGFDPNKRMLVVDLESSPRMSALMWCEQVSERLAALPGVRGATFARRLPLSGSGGGMTVRFEIPGQAPRGVPVYNVGGNYFSVMGTRVLAGRGIDTNDRENSALVAVLSQRLAHQAFPGRNPIGQWVSVDGKMRQIVGIAEDGPVEDLHEPPAPSLYLPFSQMPWGGITLMVETASDPGALTKAVRQEIKRFDPGVLVATTTLRAFMQQALAFDQLLVRVSSGLGVFGFLLTAAGLFGVIQYAVNRRTREIGLRMALGAHPSEIKQMVLRESLRLAAVGVPLGLLLLAPLTWSVRSVVIGVTPLSPLMYLASAAAAIVIALSAAWLPAQRATRIDPMSALRSE